MEGLIWGIFSNLVKEMVSKGNFKGSIMLVSKGVREFIPSRWEGIEWDFTKEFNPERGDNEKISVT